MRLPQCLLTAFLDGLPILDVIDGYPALLLFQPIQLSCTLLMNDSGILWQRQQQFSVAGKDFPVVAVLQNDTANGVFIHFRCMYGGICLGEEVKASGVVHTQIIVSIVLPVIEIFKASHLLPVKTVHPYLFHVAVLPGAGDETSVGADVLEAVCRDDVAEWKRGFGIVATRYHEQEKSHNIERAYHS